MRKIKTNFPIMVFKNHDYSKLPIGKIEFNKTFNPEKIDWDKYCFGAGYIPKEVDENGNITKCDLLEISLIKCPGGKNE